jgi:hypothetical protein
MSFLRWTLSFLGFPLGGWLAFLIFGSADSPLAAALAGAVAGTIVGAAQWFALRPAVPWQWIAGSAVGMGCGSAVAATVTASATSVPALVATGAIAGAAVGAVQGLVFRRGWPVAALWLVTVSAAWALGWVITAHVIIDADRGYVAFGSSGALVVSVITGLVLRPVLGRRTNMSGHPAARSAVVHATLGHPATAGPAAGTRR